MKDYILERLAEASTWRGMISFLTGMGVVMSPDLQAAIIAAGLAIMGLIGVVTKDRT